MTTSTTTPLTRITMFKIPSPENQRKLVEAYELLESEAEKDGKPYIISSRAAVVGEGEAGPRAKGYTVVAHQEFKDLEDMRFYDGECGAHLGVKKASKMLGVVEMPLVVYY
ncbi:hypothetical protein QBC39DRAFT_255286 [Podospora conica]|nr:hypothetical protein QBC39DRAFT_255286 [Schizothecium conicum]